MIDDIDYEATMCTDAYNTLDLGRDFYTTPMLGVIFNRAAHSSKVCCFVGVECVARSCIETTTLTLSHFIFLTSLNW